MIADLEQELREAVALHREVVAELVAIGRLVQLVGDKVERLADHLYADEQDDLVVSLGREA